MMHSTTQFTNRNASAVLLVAIAAAICLFVAFVGVLQSAVQRGELFRQQLTIGSSGSTPMALNAGDGTSGAAAYSTRFHLNQQTLGASLAPSLILAVQGSR